MSASNKKKTILVVDDVLTHLQQIKDTFGREVNVVPTQSAATAFKAVEAMNIDLFLVDINMPEISGVEFVKKLREHPKHLNTPVIFVTSETDLGVAMDVITSDVAGYVKKPFNENLLRKKVFDALKMEN